MNDHRFFERAAPLSVAAIAELIGAEPPTGDASRTIEDVATLRSAGPRDVAFFDNPRYESDLAASGAGACIVASRMASKVPPGTAALVVARPGDMFADLVRRFYPGAMRPLPVWGDGDPTPTGVHPTAVLETDVAIEPGAIVGAHAQIGRGTRIRSGAVVGQHVCIGRDCVIGPNVTIIHTLIGDRVILHPGVCLGQDGFGYSMGAAGHRKVPQIGRVIVQDDVEIGANATVDRGAVDDTVIGEGTKIDNQVQIGHNVVVGRHCVIVAQVGISGSATLGDFVAIGGQSGVQGHITIGDGAQVAAISVVRDDLAAGGRYGGTPARPVRDWFREHTAQQKMIEDYLAGRHGADRKDRGGGDSDG